MFVARWAGAAVDVFVRVAVGEERAAGRRVVLAGVEGVFVVIAIEATAGRGFSGSGGSGSGSGGRGGSRAFMRSGRAVTVTIRVHAGAIVVMLAERAVVPAVV